VAGGTYPPQTILYDATKTKPNVIIRPVSGQEVNIVAPQEGMAISLGRNSDDPSSRAPSYLTIAGVHAIGGLKQWPGSPRNSFQTRSLTLRDSSFTDVRSRVGVLVTFTYADDLKVINNEIGPLCCGTDGLNIGNAGRAGTDASNVVIDHNYIHDVTWDCSTNPDPSCTNSYNCPANTKVCNHSDGSQIFGVKTLMMSNNRYYNAGGQNIFLQSALGGVFSNLTFVNNMVSTSAGSRVTNSVSLSGPGVGVVSGYVRFINNTFQRGLVIYDVLPGNRVLAPGTKVEMIGNIFGYAGPDNGALRCTFTAGDGSQIQPFYSHNLLGNKQCGSTDRHGKAVFVSQDPSHPDLHLVRGSPGVSAGDKAAVPRVDIDGQLRPLRWAPDVGADQREPAAIEAGHGLGAISLGESEAAVKNFYGAPRSVKTAGPSGRKARIASYRLHRGTLWVVYVGKGVVAVGTSSSFYELGKIHVGSQISAARSSGALRWSTCRNAYGSGARQKRLYFAPAGGRKGKKVGSIWVLSAGVAECLTPR
jgi:hypothetical protein